ncbi:hypothetical protein A2661_00545 [Candidatus Giovannonibacteria bacterium RIFCSPHIGHO2_01_FULL_45_24]|uniref:GtrA/DPMS transmembrane domain-containing protein n=1 Tax=Candidatus Giovannonibacteria bacterium RIFCSPLOWO2_01_FULL_46_32 TaxID=1798353 RepID=A0A1F5XGW8_9BACT|nr:MAG: hypothetical protein A2661_00545 [Candidatus Giovannonibacteria bacterium RIFCSPHIGHO2_01_FULL_45_24]OGF87066.1 MAG: hypothetical protein A3B19_01385 [Candidatus Giovannonibacteria bacterium RIFCSPLOWO2_01_FULL_46_32]
MRLELLRVAIVGEAIALLTLPTLKNINFFEPAFVVVWLIFMPAAVSAGFYLIYLMSARRPVLLELGKYGLVGCFNFFLDAGIFNFFILITGVASGWLVDVFIIMAFAITITQSFLWNKFWIFKANDLDSAHAQYAKFFSITIATSLLGLLFMHLMINTIGAPSGFDLKVWANLALLVLIPASAMGNFLGYKFFVFNKNEPR